MKTTIKIFKIILRIKIYLLVLWAYKLLYNQIEFINQPIQINYETKIN